MAKSIVKKRLISHPEYLIIRDATLTKFQTDGHDVISLSVANYQSQATDNVSNVIPAPTPRVCLSDNSGARLSSVNTPTVSMNVFNFEERQEDLNLIYPWLMEHFEGLLKIGKMPPWKGEIVPFMAKRWVTRNTDTGDICVWKRHIVDRRKKPEMLLMRVNGIEAGDVSWEKLLETAGGMACGHCRTVPMQGPERCIFA